MLRAIALGLALLTASPGAWAIDFPPPPVHRTGLLEVRDYRPAPRYDRRFGRPGRRFNGPGFRRDITINRGYYGGRYGRYRGYRRYDDGPNWGGVAAGVALGVGVTALAASAASARAYPPPPPYPGYGYPPY